LHQASSIENLSASAFGADFLDNKRQTMTMTKKYGIKMIKGKLIPNLIRETNI
jgi:hypothetical protein